MPSINILSPHVADMIAAGEVVERPASVIKELVENSFDAGAKNVTIEIRNGGMTLIRVKDDGCGMSPADAGIAFLRHATSKLKDEAGLEAISTFGFRGEALAAVSSVSHMEIISREKGSAEGIKLELDAGEISEMLPFGCPEGTVLAVKDLFFNTPARLKFMKSDRAEASACEAAALRCALARPDVSLRFIKDGEEQLFSPGSGDIKSSIYALLGREEAVSMLECRASAEKMSIEGFVSSPSAGRGNRSRQFFFINGRCIKSQLLQSALEQAYKNTLLTGRYPACVLHIKMPFNALDVNVHPAKTEVRFGNEKSVFDFVYSAVKMALEEEYGNSCKLQATSFKETGDADSCKLQATSFKEKAVHAPQLQANQSRRAGEPESRSPESVVGGVGSSERELRETSHEPRATKPMPPTSLKEPPESYTQISLNMTPSISQHAQTPQKSGNSEVFGNFTGKNVEKPVQNVENQPRKEYKILGQAFNTYIIIEQNGEILLIDKHAAHERIIFDRLCKTEYSPSSQLLICPVTLKLSGADAEALEENAEFLSLLGFEIEPFGEREYIVRAVPEDILSSDVVPAVEEICEKLRSGTGIDPKQKREEVLHTVACKAAIKAGWSTSREELEKLADAVVSGEIKYCPHGRPVSITVTRRELDKLFKRTL